MSPRYLLVLGRKSWARAAILERMSVQTEFTLAYSNESISALASQSCPCVPIGESGCFLGSLFRRYGRAERVALLSTDEISKMAIPGPRFLDKFWGGYIAIIANGPLFRVLRDPSGNFPCYFSTADGLVVVASDADLLVEIGMANASIDFEAIGRQLYRAFIPSPETALSDIRELLAGFAIEFPTTDAKQRAWWSPWDHTDRCSTDGVEDATKSLPRTVAHCIQSWGSSEKRLLLSVSGGLDSSIVAACLSKSGVDTVCLTMFTDDPSGDEREYARALCTYLGLPLIERPYRLEDINITEALASHLPRPRDRSDATAYQRVHYEVAQDIGASVFITGNGGDNVFGYSQSAAPITDRYLTEGLGVGLFNSLFDVCRQTGCNMLDAIGHAWRLMHSDSYRVRGNPLLLHRDFVASLGPAELRHEWLSPPVDALPGKIMHIGNILRAQPNLEPLRDVRYSVLNPLVSQPIVEECLRIPSWKWREGGFDRAVARRAFANDLPPIILDRRIKGTPNRFTAKILDHFRKPIRERLVGGRLAANGIVDRTALDHILAGDGPVSDLERVRILELVNVEAWIDHWSARTAALDSRQLNVRLDGHGRPPA